MHANGAMGWERAVSPWSEPRSLKPPVKRSDRECTFLGCHDLPGWTANTVEQLHCAKCPYAQAKTGEAHRFFQAWKRNPTLVQGMKLGGKHAAIHSHILSRAVLV